MKSVRVHPGSLLSSCIRLHGTSSKSHTCMTQTTSVVVPDRNCQISVLEKLYLLYRYRVNVVSRTSHSGPNWHALEN